VWVLVVEQPVEAAGQGVERAVAGEGVLWALAVVDDGAHLVVVPAVAVVVGDDDGGVLPVVRGLQPVHGVHDEVLLVQRVGLGRVRVLVDSGLEVADGGHLPGVHRAPEVGQVVLVVGLAVVPDLGDRGGRQMVRVGGGPVVLEGFEGVVVVLDGFAANAAVYLGVEADTCAYAEASTAWG
jgi:hypothetical protein